MKSVLAGVRGNTFFITSLKGWIVLGYFGKELTKLNLNLASSLVFFLPRARVLKGFVCFVLLISEVGSKRLTPETSFARQWPPKVLLNISWQFRS